MDDTTPPAPARQGAPSLADRYLDLMKRCLTRELFIAEEVTDTMWWPLEDADSFWSLLDENGWRLVTTGGDRAARQEGRDYPPDAETMVGLARLDNVQQLVRTVLDEDIPGDLVETGIWRGGTVIFMRAVLEAYGDPDRQVWAFDSFEGLPEADPTAYPEDASMLMEDESEAALMKSLLGVSVAQVTANFERYGLFDERVRLVEGWFRDTLPSAGVDQIAVLRLDGDLYESTMDALVHLEPKVSPGGFVIVDDYTSIDACRLACTHYRDRHGIVDPIHEIDWTGVWWRKSPR